MAAPVIEAADCTVSGSNTAAATWAVSHPAASAGDLLIWNIAWDDSTDTTDVAEPAGPNSEVLSEINATPVASNGTEVRGKCWYTICTGAWSGGTLTFTPAASESWTATVIRVPAGEFDPADPIGNVLTRSSADTTDTTVENPVGDLAANDGTGTLVWFAFVDADPLSGTNPTGWTIRQAQDLGAVAHGVATRDTQTTNGETVAETTWGIAGDSWGGISYVVRGPPVYAVAGTVRFVGQTPTVETTNLGQNAWATGAWASGAWATGAWDVEASVSHTVTPSVGTFRLVGLTPSVSYTDPQTAAPTVGTVRFVGAAPTVGFTHSVSPTVGAVQIAGQAPVAGFTHSVAPSAGVLRFDGQAPSIPADGYAWASGAWAVGAWAAGAWAPGTLDATASPTAGVVRFVGQAPAVGYTQSVAPSVGAVVVSGQQPSLSFTDNMAVAPSVGSLIFAGQQPSVGATFSVAPSVGTLLFGGQQPTVAYTDHVAVAPSVGTVRFAGAAPSVGFTHSVAPSVATLRFVGLQPTITWGDNQAVQPSTGTLVFVGQTPTVENLSGYAWHPNAWASGAWAVGAWAPDQPGTTVSPSVGTLRFEGQTPTVETGEKSVAPQTGVLRFVGNAPPLGDTSALVDFDTPAQNLQIGADLQTFRVLVRKTAGTNPTVDVDLYESGSWVADLVSGTAVTSESGQIVSATWNASLLADISGAGVQAFIYGHSSADAQVEIGAVEWQAAIEAVVTPTAGTFRFVGQAPGVASSDSTSAAPSVGTVRVVGQQPSPASTDHVWITPTAGEVRFGGYAPVLSATAHQWTVPSSGELRFVGQQPTLIEGGDKTTAPQSGVIRFVGNAPIASLPRERVGGDDLPPGWSKRRARLKLNRELEYTEQIREIYRQLTGSPQAAEAEAILAPVVPPVAATGESEDARFAAIEARAEALRVRADRLDYDAVQAEIALRLLYQQWRQQMEDDDVAAMELLLSHVL